MHKSITEYQFCQCPHCPSHFGFELTLEVPCRALVVVRFAVMVLFLTWRVTTPNPKAYWLWLTSVVCEIWFAVSWLFDQVRDPRVFFRSDYQTGLLTCGSVELLQKLGV